MWVEDIEQACEQVEAAGATHLMGNKSGDPNSFYEVKYRDPHGQRLRHHHQWLEGRDQGREAGLTKIAAPAHTGAAACPAAPLYYCRPIIFRMRTAR